MTAPQRRPTTIREWLISYCERHGIPLPPEEPVEADDAGHVASLPPKPWSDTEKDEEGTP